MAPFVCPLSKNHSLNANSPICHTNSTFIVFTIISQQLVQIVFTGFLFGRYKGLPSMNNTLTRALFFSCLFVSFLSHTFSWSCRSLREPQKIFSVYSLVSPILLMDFSQTWFSTSPLYIYLSYCFQPKEHT